MAEFYQVRKSPQEVRAMLESFLGQKGTRPDIPRGAIPGEKTAEEEIKISIEDGKLASIKETRPEEP